MDSLYNDTIMTVTGNKEVILENYKGICEYSDEVLIVVTYKGRIRISGKNLKVLYYTNEELKLKGSLHSVVFELSQGGA